LTLLSHAGGLFDRHEQVPIVLDITFIMIYLSNDGWMGKIKTKNAHSASAVEK
jgi:hypothetical protein